MAHTHRKTDKQTDRRTWRIVDRIGPDGRFSEEEKFSLTLGHPPPHITILFQRYPFCC